DLLVEPGLLADLSEARVTVLGEALVQEEQVADAEVVGGEPGRRARDRPVGFGVPGDEEIGAAVSVHVRDGGARAPTDGYNRGRASAVAERAGARVPERL